MSLASVGRRLLPALAAAVAVCAPAVNLPARAQSTPIVRTAMGDVQGTAEHGVLAFKGIPFAAPPVGPLRWREPNPAAAWQGVRSADAVANGCVAVPGIPADFGGETGPQGEDCLYLNVWTPKAEPGARLPVMVWIHGGAFVFGSGGVQLYSGAPLARKGAVVVTINYRLLQLGFFAHPALEREQPGGPVNFGLFDQVAALEWVQRNIAAFGGDPGNVTIFGQSAGAKSVLALFASPMARGLFHKGIAQSSYIVPEATRAKAREAGIKTADGLGLPGPRATAAELRAVPAEKFAQLKGKGFSTSPVAAWGDTVLPQSIQATFAAGRQAALPLILGNTSDDISVASAFGIDTSALLKRLGAAGFLVRALYPGVKDTSEVARLAAGDVVFTMPVRWIAERHAQRALVWRYYFDYVTVNNRPKFPNGVQHGGEIPYVLGTLDIFDTTKTIATDKDREVARQLSTYWFRFARTGRPSADGAPAWPNHRARQDRTLVVEDEIEVQKNFMGARLRILLGVSKIVGKVLGR